MTPSHQLQQDLSFVRSAVERQRRERSPAGILWLWAVYVLVGYTWLDFNPRAGGMFLAIAGPICGVLSWFIGAAAARRLGESDRAAARMEMLHWLAVLLGFGAVVALSVIHPALRSNVGGQVIVVVIGVVYYLYGVHKDAQFLWLGPVMIVGGIAVSFIPSYPWTLLGAVIAIGLVVPTLLRRPTPAGPDQPVA